VIQSTMAALCSKSITPAVAKAGVRSQVRPVLRAVAPASRQAASKRSVAVGFFKFGKNGFGAEDAGIVGSQARDDYNYDDVEQYFNYMGFLATEGTYDRWERSAIISSRWAAC
jgi:hypothetical protein